MRANALPSTLASMADNCISMKQLKQIQAHSIVTYLHHHSIVLAKMFRFAAVSPSGDLRYADHMFAQMPKPNTFFYNTLIRGYSKSSLPSHAVHLFNQMRFNGVYPDEFTLKFLVTARSKVRVNLPLTTAADEIHGIVLKFGFCSYLFVQNSLINLYAVMALTCAARKVFDEIVDATVVSWLGLLVAHVKAGELKFARKVFDEMPERNVVCWTAMISGYAQAKHSKEALNLFWEMRDAGVRPDEVTMVIVISACTNLGDMEMGYSIHQYIEENGFGRMCTLCNALIYMYAKFGSMDQAWKIFNNMKSKSLITWNSMISACAKHGNAEGAFELFNHMLNSGFQPDGVTFVALLSAYAHKGLVNEGCMMLESMQKDYGIEPRIEHYGSMVDMLSRAGRLEDAYKLITTMKLPSNDIVWSALLGGCRMYGDVDMGERVVRKLIELKPDNGGYYLLLHEIYIAAGRQDAANEWRETMRLSGARTTPGCTWIGA